MKKRVIIDGVEYVPVSKSSAANVRAVLIASFWGYYNEGLNKKHPDLGSQLYVHVTDNVSCTDLTIDRLVAEYGHYGEIADDDTEAS